MPHSCPPDITAGAAARALARREAELRAVLQAQGGVPAAAEANSDVHDFKDAAGDEMRAAVDDVVAAGALTELQAVRAALRRLADGSYGNCLECGEPIEAQRLGALPQAALCAGCQSQLERAQAHPR